MMCLVEKVLTKYTRGANRIKIPTLTHTDGTVHNEIALILIYMYNAFYTISQSHHGTL